jgi:hypothetical protein
LALYLLEISLKFFLLGRERMTETLAHLYDSVIIILAIIGKIIDFVYPNTDTSLFPHSASIIISLRALRLIPALGIFNRLNVIAQILPFMFYSMLTVWLFIYIFAILGLELFATQYYHDTTVDVFADVNIQFENFVGAMMALFQVLVSNNWDEIMYTGIYSTGSIFLPALYFISFHFITASLLLQLVIAIYVEAFETFSNEQQKEEEMSLSHPSPEQPPRRSPPLTLRPRIERGLSGGGGSQAVSSFSHQSSFESTIISSPPPSTLTQESSVPSSDASPPIKIQELAGYLLKQTSQKLFPSSNSGSTPQPTPPPDEFLRLSPNYDRRESLEKSHSSYLQRRPAPLMMRHSSSSLNHNSRGTTPSKPLHKFVRKSVIPKSAIHSLARVHLKEFEEDELRQIQILGDVDVMREIEIRDEISRKVENQIVLHEKTLKEMIQRHSLTLQKADTFESLRGSFEENATTGEIAI